MSRVTSLSSFQALLASKPTEAKRWLEKVSEHTDGVLKRGEQVGLRQLTALSVDAFAQQAATSPALTALFAAGARAVTSSATADLPALSGTLSVERGARVVRGEQGYREWPDLQLTLTTADGRALRLESDNEQRSDIFAFVPGTDVMAFSGRAVSVRGHVDPTSSVMRVTEFAPGTSPDFVSGRVKVDGTRVFVQPRGRDRVEVTNPALAEQLRGHPNLGVILQGSMSERVGTDGSSVRSFDGGLEDYWMLVRIEQPMTQNAQGLMEARMVAATSSTHTTLELSAQEAAKVEVGDRMYVRGRFEGSRVRAVEATPSAGSPWTVAKAQRGPLIRSVFEVLETEAGD